MAKRNKKIDPAQILLPVVRIAVWVDPTALHGLDAGPVCRCNDSCEYATKSVKHHPLVPHSEWFCTHLAELAGIAAPSCAVIEMPSGENVFGSRWEPTSPAPSPPWWAEVRAGNIPLADIRDALTRIYAFDHFINNTDRHANNFIVRRQKNGHAVLAIDYSRSWLVNGFPLPPPPVYAASHTVTFQRQTTAMWTSYINPIEARSVMEIIKQIPTHRIRNIIEMHPRIWLSDRKKKAILKWWSNGEMQSRAELVARGIEDGTYL